MPRHLLAPALALTLASSLVPAPAPAQEGVPAVGKSSRKVVKTDQQWARQLTAEQFQVTRRKATEPAFSGKYATSHAKGGYACVCCAAPLFTSAAKFDSGTGWPSFWRPVDLKRIETAADHHLAEPRIEVLCADCGAHLGHVFDDGPPPTGLRYCINSAALKFVPASAAAAARKPARTAPKTAAKGKAKPREVAADDAPQSPTGGETGAPAPADAKESGSGGR